MAMAAAASSSLVSIRSDRRTNGGGSRHGNYNSTTVTCRASFPFSGRTISIASPSCSSRFISVLSSPSQVRSRRTTQIFALDPDFYKIPYVEGVPVGKKLKIWNLPPNTDPQEFRQWFDGLEGVSVESVEFTDDPELNSQGIGGFIEFGTKQEACMAIVRRDGYKFKGKCVRMDFVEKKPHEREIGGRRNRPTYRSSSFSPSNSRMGSSSPSSGSYGGSSSGYGSGANSNPSFASASASSAPVSRMGNNEPTTFKPYGNTPNITSSTNLNTNANMNNVSNLSPTTRSYGAEASPAANDSGSSGFSGSKDSLFGSGSGSYVSPPSFGAPSNTPSNYGGTNAPIQSTPNYGAGSSTSSYGSPSSTYGNTPSYGNTPGYGNAPSYGNPPSTPNYGNTQPAPGYGNTPSTPSFGNTPSTSSFGNTPASSGYGQSPASSYPQMSDDKPFGLNSNNLGDVDSKSSSSTSSYGSQPISTPNYGVNSLQSNSSYGDNKSYGGSTQSRSSYGSMDYGQSIASTPFSGGNEPSSFGANSNMSFGGSSDSSSSYGAYSSSGTGYGRSEYSQSYGNSEPRPSYGGYGSSPRPSSTNRIFVGNLPWSTDDMSLQQLFSEFGAVLEARVVKDRETGRSRGFGFISMSTADEMNAAIQGLDGRQVDGRAIRVNQAESRF